jgi:ATP-dependent DNA helicase RecQ
MELNFDQQIALSDNARRGISALAIDFVRELTPIHKELVYRAFLQLDELSEGLKTPRSLQLQCLLALKDGKDVVVRAGTGYGKTIAMILPILLTPGKIAVIVSPLKLLQTSQVCPFADAHGLRRGTMFSG